MARGDFTSAGTLVRMGCRPCSLNFGETHKATLDGMGSIGPPRLVTCKAPAPAIAGAGRGDRASPPGDGQSTRARRGGRSQVAIGQACPVTSKAPPLDAWGGERGRNLQDGSDQRMVLLTYPFHPQAVLLGEKRGEVRWLAHLNCNEQPSAPVGCWTSVAVRS